MNIEEIREYCMSKKFVTESFPFNNITLVFKVHNKMFALLNLDNKSINLKCEPEKAINLREKFLFVLPGYHMNKKYWNTILIEEAGCRNLLTNWIDSSYDLVFSKLPKRIRENNILIK